MASALGGHVRVCRGLGEHAAMLTQSREHGTRCGRVVHASEDVSPLMGREKSGDLRPPLAMQVHDLACRSCLNKKIKQFAVVLAIQRDVERDHLYAGGDLAGIGGEFHRERTP